MLDEIGSYPDGTRVRVRRSECKPPPARALGIAEPFPPADELCTCEQCAYCRKDRKV